MVARRILTLACALPVLLAAVSPALASGGAPGAVSRRVVSGAVLDAHPLAACPASGPMLSKPDDGVVAVSPVGFEWDPVPGATGYRFNLDRDGLPVVRQVQPATDFQLDLAPGSYTWSIDALAPNCTPQASSKRTFRVAVPASTCPVEFPKPSSPAQSAILTSSTVDLSWSAVTNASVYVVRVFGASGMVADRSLAGTFTSLSLSPGRYEWYVAAAAEGCQPIASPTREFFVDTDTTGCPPFAPALVAPAQGAKLASPITFVWSPVPSATEYRFVVTGVDGTDVLEARQAETSLRRELPPGEYLWRVEAGGSGCDPIASDRWLVSVPSTGTNCPTTPPVLSTPARGSESGSSVHLSWSAVQGATWYDLVVFSNATIALQQQVTATSFDATLAAGEYSWVVVARASGCTPVVSDHSFFIVTCGKGAPSLVAPADGASSQTRVQFSWTAVNGASGYHVQIISPGGLYLEAMSEATSATFDLRPGLYRWVVLSVFDSCPEEASASRALRVEGDVACPDTGPTLVSPGDEESVAVVPVAFQWQAVTGADGYWLLAGASEKELHVAAETDGTSASIVLPPGAWVWQVVANSRDCGSVRSEVRRFTISQSGSCDHASPSLLQPAEDSSVSLPVTFAWSSVAGALGYELVLVPDGGAPTPIVRTSTTSATIDVLRPGSYGWFVVAAFDRCPPTESDHARFEVPYQGKCDRRSPVLLSPEYDAEQVPSPVLFSWTPVPDATAYRVWISVDGEAFSSAGETSETHLSASVVAGLVRWYVEADLSGCPGVRSEPSRFTAAESSEPCGVRSAPGISLIGSAGSGEPYVVRWSAVANAGSYEIDESLTPDFRDVSTGTTSNLSFKRRHEVGRETVWFYRVRGIDQCSEEPGPYSRPAPIVIRPPISSSASNIDLVRELGDLDVINQTIVASPTTSSANRMPMLTAGARGTSLSRKRGAKRPEVAFTASASAPWLTISPASGTLSGGVAEITASADPANLPPGTSTATVTVSMTGGGISARGDSGTTTVPVSVTLVTPVVPSPPSSAPPPDALVIPWVAHQSTGESVESHCNLALSNTSASSRKAQLSFRSLDEEGRVSSRRTEIQLDPGQTASLDDVVAKWFGAGEASISGVVEIRDLDEESGDLSATSPLVASAIQFSADATVSIGGRVPTIPFSDFIGNSAGGDSLVLPDIHADADESSGISLVEGSGQSATVSVTVFDSSGQKIAEQSVNLQGGESTAVDDLLEGLSLSGGHATIAVTSGSGQVTAFQRLASAETIDSRFIPAASASATTDTQVVAGATETTDGSIARHTDLWLYNPSTSTETVTLRFFPEGDPESVQTKDLTLDSGEAETISDAVNTLFGQSGVRGAIFVDSAGGVIMTAYERLVSSDGSISTVLPVISESDAIGKDDAPLQLLHVSESSALTTNVGIAEVTGNGATVEVSAIVPGALAAPIVTIELDGYEFREISSVLAQMGLSDIHDARIAVRVKSGSGSIVGYAALQDRETGNVTVMPGE